jgi:hypothetical protein
VDDDIALARRAKPLARVTFVDRGECTVTVDAKLAVPDTDKHPLLRRWDQREHTTAGGVLAVTESGEENTGWLDLEDGISVQFQPGGLYRTGDYWLIPARVATGGIEWPADQNANHEPTPRACAPHGVEHHLAVLGVLAKSLAPAPCGCVLNGLCAGKP